MVSTDLRSGQLTSGFALDNEISELRARATGSILLPGDAGYDQARQTVSFLFDRHPFLILQAANEDDVALGVRFARENGIGLSVRSGAHSLIGASVIDDAVMIDLSHMKEIRIDPVARTARVQPGANSGDLGVAARPHQLALTTGDTYSVGLGGLVSGGGIGFMVRKYGLTIDNLLSARVVTADGQIRTASAVENPDLFWALRGGGGNVGIATEFTFRMAPVGEIYGGELFLPATQDVVRGYLDLSVAAPDELTLIADLSYVPPIPTVPEAIVGQPTLHVIVTWTGDEESGIAALAPFRALAEPMLDTVAMMPYPDIYKITEAFAERHGASIRSMFATDISDDAIAAMLEALGNATSPFSLIQLRGLGGHYGRVEPGAMAFPHRSSRFFVAIIGIWLDPAEDPGRHRAWTAALWDKIKNEGSGVYVNFLEAEGIERIQEAYAGANYERLARIKAYYDPDNLFRNNQNVLPAEPPAI